MSVQRARRPEEVEAAARRHPALHAYVLGDLDPSVWKRSRWWIDDDDQAGLCGVVDGPGLPGPVLYGVADEDDVDAVVSVAKAVVRELPAEVFGNVHPAVADALAPRFALTGAERYEKQVLSEPSRLRLGEPGVVALRRADLDELKALYALEPDGDRFFADSMIDTGCYLGIRDDEELVAVAGVHVYSPERGVAAVGNVFTRPDHRGRGLGRRVTSALCRRLATVVDLVVLNVAVDNTAAVEMYGSLGFRPVGTYLEGQMTAR